MDDTNETEAPDLGRLAGEYMDLWQKQLSGMATDETFAAMMAQTAALMNNSAAMIAAMSARTAGENPPAGEMSDPDNGPRGGNHDGNDDGNDASSDTSLRPAPAGVAHGHADHAVRHLARRVERLEERLAALESGTGTKGSRSS